MGYDFFDIEEEPEEEEPTKEACPYCGKEFVSVARHLPHCEENPDNKQKAEAKPVKKIEPSPSVNGDDLRKEIREELLKSLIKDELNMIPQLTPEEKEKIENVQKFLGGTEGYQFIYKTITGDKIRGKMTDIIDESIKWLKKHKAYLLWYK